LTAWCIIPARGGSKGVPDKNLQPVGGRALVTRAIEAARGADEISVVIVSTDDDRIAEVAREIGATIVSRPHGLAGDESSSESAVLHALEVVAADQRTWPDVTAMVQCTSPFVLPGDIDGTVRLVQRDFDSAFAACRHHGFVWRHREDDTEAVMGVNHDAGARPRRQERPVEYLETGAVYAMRTEGLLEYRHRFFGRIGLHMTSADRALEIDEQSDLTRARLVSSVLDHETRVERLPAVVRALALDFDGVMTDNRVLTLDDGSEGVIANRGDGLGLERLRSCDVSVVVLSKEQNPVVTARCKKLGIEAVQGVDDKLQALRQWASDKGIGLGEVVFVGNDVNDLDVLEAVGCGVVVNDYHPDVLDAADVVLRQRGGHGAVREVCDLIERRLAEGR
jgi:N-acylneuraminate cytidylyltransferase